MRRTAVVLAALLAAAAVHAQSDMGPGGDASDDALAVHRLLLVRAPGMTLVHPTDGIPASDRVRARIAEHLAGIRDSAELQAGYIDSLSEPFTPPAETRALLGDNRLIQVVDTGRHETIAEYWAAAIEPLDSTAERMVLIYPVAFDSSGTVAYTQTRTLTARGAPWRAIVARKTNGVWEVMRMFDDEHVGR